MTEEIKEILKGIKIVIKQEGTMEFNSNELKNFYNYITNLQQENERLKNDVEDISCSHFILFKSYEDYKSRCEKAIEYIKEHQRKDEFLNLNEWQTRDLLKLLEEE